MVLLYTEKCLKALRYTCAVSTRQDIDLRWQSLSSTVFVGVHVDQGISLVVLSQGFERSDIKHASLLNSLTTSEKPEGQEDIDVIEHGGLLQPDSPLAQTDKFSLILTSQLDAHPKQSRRSH